MLDFTITRNHERLLKTTKGVSRFLKTSQSFERFYNCSKDFKKRLKAFQERSQSYETFVNTVKGYSITEGIISLFKPCPPFFYIATRPELLCCIFSPNGHLVWNRNFRRLLSSDGQDLKSFQYG